MGIISGLADFSTIKNISPPRADERSCIVYHDDRVFLYSSPDDSVFFQKNNTVFIYLESTALIYRPEFIMFKTDNTRIYYTFLGSCFIFSTDCEFVKTYDRIGKNINFIDKNKYAKFTKSGIRIY